MSNPKLSVCVVTYNQQDYISQCLESILEQNVNFEFEIIIADDCSQDKTRHIIENYMKNHSNIIPLFHDKNVGALKNYMIAHSKAKGQYIAHVDGDDYIAPGKLQSQVEYLDRNEGVSLATHAVNIIGTNVIHGNDDCYPELGSIKDLLHFGTYFVNSSIMYRREHRIEYKEGIEPVDFYLHVERAGKGNIYLDKRVFGYYRDHDKGISKLKSYKINIEEWYFKAYDRAIELGVDVDLVTRAKLKRKRIFAYSRFFNGDIVGYKKLIALKQGEARYVDKWHYLLSKTRALPVLMWLIKIGREAKRKIVK